MVNNPVIYEVLTEQYLRSILDISVILGYTFALCEFVMSPFQIKSHVHASELSTWFGHFVNVREKIPHKGHSEWD